MRVLVIEGNTTIAANIAEVIRNLHAIDTVTVVTCEHQRKHGRRWYGWPMLDDIEIYIAESDIIIMDIDFHETRQPPYHGYELFSLARMMRKRVIGITNDKAFAPHNFADKENLRKDPSADETLRELVIEVIAESVLARN